MKEIPNLEATGYQKVSKVKMVLFHIVYCLLRNYSSVIFMRRILFAGEKLEKKIENCLLEMSSDLITRKLLLLFLLEIE